MFTGVLVTAETHVGKQQRFVSQLLDVFATGKVNFRDGSEQTIVHAATRKPRLVVSTSHGLLTQDQPIQALTP